LSVTISLHVLPAVIAFITGMVVSIMFFLIFSLLLKYPNVKAKEALNLGLFCLGSSIYVLGQVLLNDNTNACFAIFWHRTEHAGLLLVITSYIAFTYSYVSRKRDLYII